MGGNLSCCKLDVNTLAVATLKQGLEGVRRKMKDHPELWLTIKELDLKDDGNASFNSTKFCFEGVRVRADIELVGSTAEIVAEIGPQAALKLLDMVGVSTASKGELAGKEFSSGSQKQKQKLVSNSTSLIEVKERHAPSTNRVGGGSGTWTGGSEHKSFEVLITVNMFRELGEGDVGIEIKGLGTSFTAAQAALENESTRKNIEIALSKMATEVIKTKISEKLEQFKPAQ